MKVPYTMYRARRQGYPEAIPLADVTVSTRRYFSSHWKEPRGEGYWGFFVFDTPGGHERLVWLHGPARTFTEARREIVEYAARRGLNYVEVAP